MNRLFTKEECKTLEALATNHGLNALVTCQGREGYIRNMQSDVVRAIDTIYREAVTDDKEPLYVNCGHCVLTFIKKVSAVWIESKLANRRKI